MSHCRQFIPLKEARAPFFVGIDLGGTNIKVGVVDDLGRPLSWLTVPTQIETGAEDAARRMGEAVLRTIGEAGLRPGDIARVGLGSPGIMDIPAGMLLKPANLRGWNDFPLRDRVSRHCGLPVSFENDANAAAYGEFWVGAGREYRSLVLFTLGTGIGSGIIVDDLIVDGECGHIIIDCDDDARMCGCGQRGHLEAYAGATAVVQRMEELLASGRKSSLAARLESCGELSPLMMAQEAEKGDALCLEVILDTARYMGVGIVNLLHTIDPNAVLLGGAMTFGGNTSDLGRRFLARIQEEVNRRAFPVLAQRTAITFASLGGDAGFIGAAGIARLQHAKK